MAEVEKMEIVIDSDEEEEEQIDLSTYRKERILQAIFEEVHHDHILKVAAEFVNIPQDTTDVEREIHKVIVYSPCNLTIESRVRKLVQWEEFIYAKEGLKAVHTQMNELCELENHLVARKASKPIPVQKVQQLPHGLLNTAELPSGMLMPFPLRPPVVSPSRAVIASNIEEEMRKYLDSVKTDFVPLGPNGTTVPKFALMGINWRHSGQNIARKILMELFDRKTLASHTLSGKASPAFRDCNKPLKQQLDKNKIADLIHFLTNRVRMTEKEVRQSITTKCADENKMLRQRLQKLRMNAEKMDKM